MALCEAWTLSAWACLRHLAKASAPAWSGLKDGSAGKGVAILLNAARRLHRRAIQRFQKQSQGMARTGPGIQDRAKEWLYGVVGSVPRVGVVVFEMVMGGSGGEVPPGLTSGPRCSFVWVGGVVVAGGWFGVAVGPPIASCGLAWICINHSAHE